MEKAVIESAMEELWPLDREELEQGIEQVEWDDPHHTQEGRVQSMELAGAVQDHARGAERVLEIGASTGRTTAELSSLLPDAEVVGVEMSREHVREADDYRERTGGDWRVEEGRATRLPDRYERTFDAAFALNSLGQLVDTSAVGTAAFDIATGNGAYAANGAGLDDHEDDFLVAANHLYVADVFDSLAGVLGDGAPFILADGYRYLVSEHRGGDWYAVESRDAVIQEPHPEGCEQDRPYAHTTNSKQADAIYEVWLSYMDTSERGRAEPVED